MGNLCAPLHYSNYPAWIFAGSFSSHQVYTLWVFFSYAIINLVLEHTLKDMANLISAHNHTSNSFFNYITSDVKLS